MVDLSELETPCLILDKAKLEKNITALHQRMQTLGFNLRPHGKTAKNSHILEMALQGQTGGITVSTMKEAEYYFEHGMTDIIYAVGIAPVKLNRVVQLIKKGAKVTLLLDTTEQVGFVANKAQAHNLEIPVLIELDCDNKRSGIRPGDALLVEIGQLLAKQKGVRLQGVLTHAGGSYACQSVSEIRAVADQERDIAVTCADQLRANGLSCETVSVGATPTANFAEDLTGITEVRAGVFMFQDLVMAGLGVCTIQDIAVSVLASVIGQQKEKGWTITDAGWTGLSKDLGTAQQKIKHGYGLVCDMAGKPLNDMLVSGVYQEHGILSHREKTTGQAQCLSLGEMVRILPNHACATCVMFDRYYVIDGSTTVTDVWPRINGWEAHPVELTIAEHELA